MCGKNRYILCSSTKTLGSPPRVREKLVRCLVHIVDDRITPACAGKTVSTRLLVCMHQDHPRMCGKNVPGDISKTPEEGSPPRVREKLISSNSSSRNTRITPACAGKTDYVVVLFGLILGSPPHVREKLGGSHVLSQNQRITPACAGKTLIVRL